MPSKNQLELLIQSGTPERGIYTIIQVIPDPIDQNSVVSRQRSTFTTSLEKMRELETLIYVH